MNFTNKDKIAIEILNQYHQKDLEVSIKEYRELLDTLIYLHETLADLKIPMKNWQIYSDTLITKFFLHSNTLCVILSGINLESKHFQKEINNKKILDIPSSHVILRAQLECYLMYHHIYVNPESESEKELRFNAWICSGLMERQEFPATHDLSKKQRAKDKEEIEKIKILIQGLESYKELTQKQQQSLLEKGSGKLFKHWVTILKETGFDAGSIYYSFYSILSGHAHSEGLSILDIRSSRFGYNKFNEPANMNLYLSKMLICNMVLTIKKLYKIVEIKYNMLPQNLQDKIEIYSKMMAMKS